MMVATAGLILFHGQAASSSRLRLFQQRSIVLSDLSTLAGHGLATVFPCEPRRLFSYNRGFDRHIRF